ncbi:MAG: hypothetical protein K9M75_13345 [Phycisphaerae bacterium]|nr:hypothetical protein [Phycisphaerae bacterium]
MFKTIFIIFVSVTASAITTAGLLYRYTVPVASVQPTQVASPAAPVAPPITIAPAEYANAANNPVEMLDEYVNLQTDLSAANTAQSQAAPPPPQPVKNAAATAQPQRAFDHQLLMSDISKLSKKLERFNDFLSGEVQRLKEGSTNKTNP